MEAEAFPLEGRIVAVSVSNRKGIKKSNLPECKLLEGEGLDGDAHAGDWHRQVSLLAMESINKIRGKGLEVSPGDFAENITTSGLRIWELPMGTRLAVGSEALLEVTQIGKECHDRCAIYHQVGDCVMPREGVFTRVLRGGTIRPGDEIRVLPQADG
ncbi:MAG: MOSC domain-containing protein [Deltaproteobacteria bacterium]|jgi:MOSC domain-containing protein YiiM|nr:MOSC domain-containing protein [Deltaproteobacteria bacterium]